MSIGEKYIIDAQQGSKQWHEFRAKSFGASEAAAMMGISSYKTRSQLLKEKATGIVPEVDAATQARFDRGHQYEEMARPWAEDIIESELYPVVLAREVDGLPLSASMDGLTMMEDAGWEHKSGNQRLIESLENGEIPEEYHPQLEQQLLVSGAEKILFMASSGDVYGIRSEWYTGNPELRARIIAGWKQFAIDMEEYQHEHPEPVVTGKAPDSLPALHIEVTGMVTASNLAEFKDHALAVIGGINKDLQTDEDFANAEKTVKWLGDVESRLDATKEHALSQTASIDELFRAMDDIKAEARRTRLDLDKLVKARKEARRGEIRQEAVDAYRQHIDALNARLGRVRLPEIAADFAGVMKGKRTIASLKDAVSVELARVKIEANAMADRMDANLSLIDSHAEYRFLFSDLQSLAVKEAGDLQELIAARIANHQAEEQRKLEAERERIRQEEEAKAQRDAEAKAEQERERIREIERAKILEEQEKAKAEQEATRLAQRQYEEDMDRNLAAEQTKAEMQGSIPSDVKPRVRQQPTSTRPTDDQIINTLAAAYRVDTKTVVRWLSEMKLEVAA